MVNWETGKVANGVEQQMVVKGRSINTGKVNSGGNTGLLDVHYMDPKRCAGESSTYLFYFLMAGEERGTVQALG